MQAFPVRLPTLWRQAFPGLVLGAIVGRVALWLDGQPFSFPNTVPLMVIAAVFVVLLHVLQPTRAGEAGLQVMTIWGFRRRLRWPDINTVTFARWYGLQPSLKLVDHQGRSHWIARDTRNLAGLHALALAHGGADHPLTRALQTPLHAL